MAHTSFEELIAGVTITVDPEGFIDRRRLVDILNDDQSRKTAPPQRVSGSHEMVEGVFMELCTVGRRAAPVSRATCVSAAVMEHIRKKHPREVLRIGGERVLVEEQRGAAADDVTVVFRPRHSGVSGAQVRLVRERFVTFYQRVASDLQVKNMAVHPRTTANCERLRKAFPQLVIEPQQSGVTVSGPYAHLVALEDFLLREDPSRQTDSVQEESCAICLEVTSEATKQTLACKHSYCRDCLKTAFDHKPVCPICGALYGPLKGTQPQGGTMSCSTQRSPLPGHEGHGTITVHYHIPNGVQKEEHPHPGHKYEGASRTAYLPDSPEGRKVCELLRRAFTQRLVFTVGQSFTSGRSNVVTWNDIHHKTSTHGGPTCYGYPDPDYLRRVQEELKLKGVQ